MFVEKFFGPFFVTLLFENGIFWEVWAFPCGAGFSLILLAATFQDVGCGVTASIPNANNCLLPFEPVFATVVDSNCLNCYLIYLKRFDQYFTRWMNRKLLFEHPNAVNYIIDRFNNGLLYIGERTKYF